MIWVQAAAHSVRVVPFLDRRSILERMDLNQLSHVRPWSSMVPIRGLQTSGCAIAPLWCNLGPKTWPTSTCIRIYI